MNGRIYDPLLGRFLSADVLVDGVGDLQGYNRYSYVKNRPLSLVDPSGFTVATKVWKAMRQEVSERWLSGKHSQIHHLIGREIADDPKLGKFLHEVGFNVDKRENLMVLPTKAGKEMLESSANRSVHQGRHVDDYVRNAADQISAMQKNYEAGELTKDQVKTAIAGLQKELRAGLKEGSIALTADHRDRLAKGAVVTVLGVSIANPSRAAQMEEEAKITAHYDGARELTGSLDKLKADTYLGNWLGKVVDFFNPVEDVQTALDTVIDLKELEAKNESKMDPETQEIYRKAKEKSEEVQRALGY